MNLAMNIPVTPTFEDRLGKHLPMDVVCREAYVKSKFHFMITEFFDEYFYDGQPITECALLNQIFEEMSLKQKRSITTPLGLAKAVAELFITVLDYNCWKLMVNQEVFVKHFSGAFLYRYVELDRFVGKFYPKLYRVMVDNNVDQPGIILNAALDKVDSRMVHPTTETAFVSQWLFYVVAICKSRRVKFDYSNLFPGCN